MNAIQQLHDLGQSLWLDNITRGLLIDGTLQRYIRAYCVTGLTSNPAIFERAITHGGLYGDAIRRNAAAGKSAEASFFDLALRDLVEAADLFRHVHYGTDRVDGWVSMEVSPLLADDASGMIEAASRLHARARRPNFFIKIPGTAAGLVAIEESVFAGVPVNVTLLFSAEQYRAAAEAYLRGIARRVEAGLHPEVASVASLFVSRWDVAANPCVPRRLRNRLGVAIAQRTYKAYRALLSSPGWRALEEAGARPQRLLWASTGTKDPDAPATMYVQALAAPDTINTIPEKTLHAFAKHGQVTALMPVDGGDAEEIVAEFRRSGVDDAELAAELQREGIASFVRSWHALLECIAAKGGRARADALGGAACGRESGCPA